MRPTGTASVTFTYNLVPIGVGRWVAAAIPGCRATSVPGGGHRLIVAHADEIVSALTGA